MRGLWCADGICVDSSAAVGRSGAAEAILTAMRTHRSNASVQWGACIALRVLSSTSQENCAALGSLSVHEDIFAAMRTDGSNASVRCEACAALKVLGFSAADCV